MKVTAIASSNIAFIKYWGKADDALRLPLNSSISMNLSGAYTTTTVEFSPTRESDTVTLLGGTFSQKEEARTIQALERIRKRTGLAHLARVVTHNTFPKGIGAAASASGFAALTLAGFAAAGATLSQKEQTVFARLGSGSACRSIPDGFVIWDKGTSSDDSCAYTLYPPMHWDLRDIVVIVDSHMKKVSSTEGMEGAGTSPLLQRRLAAIPDRIKRCSDALRTKDFQALGDVIEEDCLDMHAVMQSQSPPLYYWSTATEKVVASVRGWRREQIPVYFTIDAGPNVHLICEAKDEQVVIQKAREVDGAKEIIVNKPAQGAHLVDKNLF